jgi:3-keto-5-aminohexanoate cleavage enzyme
MLEAPRPRSPAFIGVAPNGARRQAADHAAIPLTAQAIGRAAAACAEAGASLFHLHVRDTAGGHSLDPDRYCAAIREIRQEAGKQLVVQVTTESAGRFSREAQMASVRSLRPEAISAALRELAPPGAEREAWQFFHDLQASNIHVQHILYSAEELRRLRELRQRGVIPAGPVSVLFVLGRYADQTAAAPADILPFLEEHRESGATDWMACAFGPDECACATTAITLGGGARVGFENNLRLADGACAPSNSALVEQLVGAIGRLGRRPATAAELRDRWALA